MGFDTKVAWHYSGGMKKVTIPRYLFTGPPGERLSPGPPYAGSVPLTRDGAELGSFCAHSGDVRNVGNE